MENPPEVNVTVVEPAVNSNEGDTEWRGRMEVRGGEILQLTTQMTNLLAEMRAEFKAAQESALTMMRTALETQQATMTQSLLQISDSLRLSNPTALSPQTIVEIPQTPPAVEVITPASVPAPAAEPTPAPVTRKRKRFL